jgi:DNA-binding NarL/FixJ family response regulator
MINLRNQYQRDRKVRILLVDDHELVRMGIRILLSHNPQWHICGEAANGIEAVEKVRELKPDLVILDISMPELNGIDAAREIRRIAPATKIIIQTTHEGSQVELAARQAGADTVITKRMAAKSLILAVDRLSDASAFDHDNSNQDSGDHGTELTE